MYITKKYLHNLHLQVQVMARCLFRFPITKGMLSPAGHLPPSGPLISESHYFYAISIPSSIRPLQPYLSVCYSTDAN